MEWPWRYICLELPLSAIRNCTWRRVVKTFNKSNYGTLSRPWAPNHSCGFPRWNGETQVLKNLNFRSRRVAEGYTFKLNLASHLAKDCTVPVSAYERFLCNHWKYVVSCYFSFSKGCQIRCCLTQSTANSNQWNCQYLLLPPPAMGGRQLHLQENWTR